MFLLKESRIYQNQEENEIKDGEIIAIHTNTVEGHIDDFEPLSQDEQGVLAEIFDNYLDKLTEKNPLGCSGC